MQTWIVGVLEARLETDDVLLELFDIGQMPRKGRQARVCGDPRLVDEVGGAIGD